MDEVILCLPSSVRLLASGPDSVYWMTESQQGMWGAPGVGTLVSILETPQAISALLASFSEGEKREQAARVLEQLIRHGLLESVSSPSSISQLCREWGMLPHSEERKRWKKGATILDLDGFVGARFLREALERMGAPLRADGELEIVTVEDYLDPRLGDVHAACHRAERSWVPMKLRGAETWVGPFFPGGGKPCWRCLEVRLRERAWLSSQIRPGTGPLWLANGLEGRMRAGAEFAAQEVIRWLLEMPGSLGSAVWSFSWASLESSRHRISPMAGCPDCGGGRNEPSWGTLSSLQPGGSIRRASAEEIVARLEALVNPITGIVSRLERRDLAPTPAVFTYGAVYNVAIPSPDLQMAGLIVHPGICSGRGFSAEEAKAACLAEAVERYSLQFRGDERRIRARYCDLGDEAIHPNAVQLFSEAQFDNREAWNRRHGADEAVAERFDENEEVEWLKGWSLTAGRARWLAMAQASIYYRPPGTRRIADADASGCASGNTLEEAALHGILELVERDALGLWWFSGARRPRLEVAALGDRLCRDIAHQLEEQGWRVWAEDITTDLAIPVYVAIATRERGWVRGSAAHLSGSIALRSAMGELWQLSKAPPRTGQPPTVGHPEEGVLRFDSEVESGYSLGGCCERIVRAGHEVVAFDMTRGEIGFPVMRMVAPGLRHAKPRFAPGRLYEVPVRLGWIARAKWEAELPEESI
jgi:oxazoline/thiazoline synthase